MHITVIEPAWNRLTHLPHNAGVLKALRHLHPEGHITFVAGKEHIANLKLIAPPTLTDTLSFVEYQPGHDQDTLPGDIWKGWQKLRRLPRQLTHGADAVVLTSCTASSLWGLVAMGLAHKALAYLHGNANDIGAWRSRHPVRRWLDFTAAIKAFTQRQGKLVVLEDRIKTSLASSHPWLQGHMYAVGHPLAEDEAPPTSQHKQMGHPIKIGFAGMATPAKGFPEYLEFVRKLHELAPGRFEFHTFGHLHNACKNCDQSLLATKAHLSIPRDQLVQGLLNMDLIFAWHGDAYYTNAASGVVYDAINLGIPLLARSSGQIDGFHEQGTPIAFTAHTVDEAVATALNTEQLKAAYPSLLNGLAQAKTKLRTPALAAALGQALQPGLAI